MNQVRSLSDFRTIRENVLINTSAYEVTEEVIRRKDMAWVAEVSCPEAAESPGVDVSDVGCETAEKPDLDLDHPVKILGITHTGWEWAEISSQLNKMHRASVNWRTRRLIKALAKHGLWLP